MRFAFNAKCDARRFLWPEVRFFVGVPICSDDYFLM
jgi:hypothetical protein